MLKQKKKWLAAILAFAFAMALLAGCGGGDTGGGDTGGGDAGTAPATTDGGGGGGAPSDIPETIKIGIPNPFTGPLGAFGIGTPWAEKLVVDYVNEELGGIYIEEYGENLPIEIIVYDTESDASKATEQTNQLIDKEGVNMLIARHTPGTALPVSAAAETKGVPCVSLECPVNPWLAGGPYEWVYHSFWTVEDNCDMFMAMWDELGMGPGTGTVVGFLFLNDPDGLAWDPIFQEKLTDAGYVISRNDPLYPIGEINDFTAIINQFKADGVEIITGCDISPDFQLFTRQAAEQNLQYKLITMGRAYLFPADVNGVIPIEIAEGLTNEVWWSPWHPWVSELTGMTCGELAAAYEQETGIGWSAPMGYKYAGMEVAADALIRAQSLDPAKIRDAIGETDLDTMVGHIKYDPVTHVAPTAIVGGQWKLTEAGDEVELMIVYNGNNPNIPTNPGVKLESPNR